MSQCWCSRISPIAGSKWGKGRKPRSRVKHSLASADPGKQDLSARAATSLMTRVDDHYSHWLRSQRCRPGRATPQCANNQRTTARVGNRGDSNPNTTYLQCYYKLCEDPVCLTLPERCSFSAVFAAILFLRSPLLIFHSSLPLLP